VEENLWLACRGCNAHKSDRTHANDPESGPLVPLFNPRADHWHEHFRWIEEGLIIVGISAIGRATVKALNLNRPSVVEARQHWLMIKQHPPAD
jgi:5-methylcytosine-specific restriction endonuclease McrA